MNAKHPTLTHTPTLGSLLPELRRRLSPSSDSAGLDAQVLLAHLTGQPRAWVLAHPEAILTPGQNQALESALSRLESGEPLPYVLGSWEFFGMRFALTPDVLIPRPETELLVETALDWLRANPSRRRIADVGTGSGCIAISLAAALPDLQITATDISPEALNVARLNVQTFNVQTQITLIQADLLNFPAEPFDLICANLPYISSDTLPTLAVFGREPASALDGGPDGLNLIRRLLREAPAKLSPGGMLLLEIGASQGDAVRALAQANFPNYEGKIKKDIPGHDRIVVVKSIQP